MHQSKNALTLAKSLSPAPVLSCAHVVRMQQPGTLGVAVTDEEGLCLGRKLSVSSTFHPLSILCLSLSFFSFVCVCVSIWRVSLPLQLCPRARFTPAVSCAFSLSLSHSLSLSSSPHLLPLFPYVCLCLRVRLTLSVAVPTCASYSPCVSGASLVLFLFPTPSFPRPPRSRPRPYPFAFFPLPLCLRGCLRARILDDGPSPLVPRYHTPSHLSLHSPSFSSFLLSHHRARACFSRLTPTPNYWFRPRLAD
jgi:hypothetical protein